MLSGAREPLQQIGARNRLGLGWDPWTHKLSGRIIYEAVELRDKGSECVPSVTALSDNASCVRQEVWRVRPGLRMSCLDVFQC